MRAPSPGAERPVVFGPADRPLVGRLHLPSGGATGSAIICPPWGYENVCAYQALRSIALRLAAEGLEVLRFDYDGTGASWGDESDPDRFASWTSSVRAAVVYLHERGFERPVLVGLRLGATLATLVASETPLGGLVAWDPIVDGRRFVRALRAMQQVSGVGTNAIGGISSAGATLTDDALDALTASNLAKMPTFATTSALLIGRRTGDEASKLCDALDALGVATTLEHPAGTTELLDIGAEEAIEPTEIVQLVVDWTAKAAAAEPSTQRADPPADVASFRSPAPLAHMVDGDAADEVTIGWQEIHRYAGPVGLALTLHLPDRRTTDGVVVLLNNGIARNIGPGRAWVGWARRWAALGIATIRVDLAGLGDSGHRPGAPPSNYPAGAVDDLHDVIELARQYGLGPIAIGGVCSGAYVAIDAAVHVDGIAGVFAVNGQYWFWPDAPGAHDPTRRAARRTPAWFHRAMRTRGGWKLDNTLPAPAWWLFDVARCTPRPSRMLERASAKTRVCIVYGTDDEGIVRLRQRDPRGLQRLTSGPDPVVVTCDGLDHSMFDPVHRQDVERLALAFFRSVLVAR
jgi:pimeloyl-ACP methyl ester carboxylesterase